MKDYKSEIIKHLEKYVGSKVTLVKNIKGEEMALGFDLAVFRANVGRPYHIISTVGLSNFKMVGKHKFVEMIIYLDKDWNLFSEEERYSWVYTLIQRLSTAFYVSERSIEYGQVFLTEGSNTFSPHTEMNSAILFYPVGLDNDMYTLKLGFNKKVNFMLITTATYKEYSIVRKLGGLAFVQDYLLEDGDIDNLVIFNKKER